jgi:hypothetical protein
MNIPMLTIPVFVINLKKRVDRREHILTQFDGRSEFDIHLTEPLPHILATKSLWLTIQYIIQKSITAGYEFVVICEDDHCFTTQYTAARFYENIAAANSFNCDILCGGVNSVKSTFSLSPGLYWMEQFTGLQFTVVFRRFFSAILELPFNDAEDCADIAISNTAKCKALLYPFISVQKEFGYSDVTTANNKPGFMGELFAQSAERIVNLSKVAGFYADAKVSLPDEQDHEGIYIPTYVLHDPDNAHHLKNIYTQFDPRPEFDIKLIRRSAGTDTLSLIKTIVKKALLNDDDIIIIATDTIHFNINYNKSLFINNIMQAHQSGATLLLCDTFGFDSAVFIAPGIAWVNSFSGANMMILFRPFFDSILSAPIDSPPDGSDKLSALTSHKMIMHPFMVQPEPRLAASDVFFWSAAEKRLTLIQASYFELSPDNTNTNTTNLNPTYAAHNPYHI